MFLRYFEQQVPANDPTLLFTNAGMNQFKDVFLGLEKRDYSRATSSQKCVRAGGKHNDLENVGFTNRHHTFFEMLGNFSFGDYFKKDAIRFAWELVTGKNWYNIPPEKLYITIFEGSGDDPIIGRDDDAEKYWLEVGVPQDRIKEMGLEDNFWQMGDTGPCGPCSEIHYDMGVAASDAGHTDCKFGCDCGRYVEIWNLVFMQFDRRFETVNEDVLKPVLNVLPKPSIDTGMGLERVAAIKQGVISNYDTDLFASLIERAGELTSSEYFRSVVDIASAGISQEEANQKNASLRIIADHSRASTFLISDGVVPANEGRGYVLRKIMRRAILHGRLLGQNKPFLHEMVLAVRDAMKDAYPELIESATQVAKVVLSEESRFAHTLEVGNEQLENLIKLTKRKHEEQQTALMDELEEERPGQIWKVIPKAWLSNSPNLIYETIEKQFGSQLSAAIRSRLTTLLEQPPILPGGEVFKLYDTFGLPLDFIEDAARDQGLQVDREGFERAMMEQRERARASWKGGVKQSARSEYLELPKTEFEGYEQTTSKGSVIRGIFISGGPLTVDLQPGQEGEVILDRTPFYADSGGQVGDIGWLYDALEDVVVADVYGCIMPIQGVRFHKVKARQRLQVGDLVNPVVNAKVRVETMRNHTATHLLHAALRENLGKHVKQAGSLVDSRHLRFDFSHFTSVADEELQDIEDRVNKEVLNNTRVEVKDKVPIDQAVYEMKAMALFGEKYGEIVRVVKIGDFSVELCGGTHTNATGEIGLVKILSEGSVSSGVRRIEAVTGEGSLQSFRKYKALGDSLRSKVHVEEETIDRLRNVGPEVFDFYERQIHKLQKEVDQLRMKSASSTLASAEDNVKVVNGIKVLAQRVDNLERPQMRTLVDNLRNKLGSGVVVLGSTVEVESDGENGAKTKEKKVALIVGVTKDLTGRVQAGKIISPIAQKVGGSGGGRPDMAEAGGKNPAALDAALNESYAVVESLTK